MYLSQRTSQVHNNQSCLPCTRSGPFLSLWPCLRPLSLTHSSALAHPLICQALPAWNSLLCSFHLFIQVFVQITRGEAIYLILICLPYQSVVSVIQEECLLCSPATGHLRLVAGTWHGLSKYLLNERIKILKSKSSESLQKTSWNNLQNMKRCGGICSYFTIHFDLAGVHPLFKHVFSGPNLY